MRVRGRLALVFLLVALCPALAGAGERWLAFRTPHLSVSYRSDLAPNYLAGLDAPDAVLARVSAEVDALEADFGRVERALRADYDAARHGRVPVGIYPSLEAYQVAVACLICAAHVGRPLWPVDEAEALWGAGAHLNAESRRGTVLHEFVHIVDFASIDNRTYPLWYEGLASYVGDRLGGEAGRRVIDEILPQYLKLYRRTHALELADYLTRRNYGRWSYNLGTVLIDLLVERGGMDRFMAFYADMDRPDAGDYDALLRRHYGLGLAELESRWEARLEATPVTAEGRAAYRLKFDQTVVRWVYLRPLLRDAERLNAAYFGLWEGGRFNEAEAELMRAYVHDFQNIVPDPALAEGLVASAAQLRGYVASYAEDPSREAALERALAEVEAAAAADPGAGCALAYFDTVHAFVGWR